MFETSGYRVGRLFGVDISISIGYLFIMGFIIAIGSLGGAVGIMNRILFVAALTISILIHEFGHAFVCKYYQLGPSILLHGFGGLCFHDRAETDGNDILVVLGGPLLQIAAGFGALAIAVFAPSLTPAGDSFVVYFIWVSFVWGGFNLVAPIWPLDGGKLFNLLLRRFVDENKAQDWTLKVSMVVSIPLGILAIMTKFYFLAFLVFFIIYDNYNALQSGRDLVGRKAKERTSDFAGELLADAESALAEEDWREAYRVCHHIRSDNFSMSKKDNDRLYEILAITSVKLEEWHEAKGWLDRAPDTAAVRQAREILKNSGN